MGDLRGERRAPPRWGIGRRSARHSLFPLRPREKIELVERGSCAMRVGRGRGFQGSGSYVSLPGSGISLGVFPGR